MKISEVIVNKLVSQIKNTVEPTRYNDLDMYYSSELIYTVDATDGSFNGLYFSVADNNFVVNKHFELVMLTNQTDHLRFKKINDEEIASALNGFLEWRQQTLSVLSRVGS